MKNNKNLPRKNTKLRLILFCMLSVFALSYLVIYALFLYPSRADKYQSGDETAASAEAFGNSTDASYFKDLIRLRVADENTSGTSDSVSSDSEEQEAADDHTNTDTNTDSFAYDKETDPQEEALVMYSDARCLYQDGFFYQPITEDVKERIYGLSYKTDCTVPYDDLRYVSVLYVDFNGETQTGEIICNKAIAQDLTEIFYELYQNSYQIDKIRLVDEYNADDDLSCADNNTSCFNYRVVEGTSNLSKHALGLAIDINPFQNPYVTYPNGKERISPPGSEPYADRSSGLAHMITENDLCYQLFIQHGFTWGGHWKSLKDYQHFQKAL